MLKFIDQPKGKYHQRCACGHERYNHHSGYSKAYGWSCGIAGCECDKFTLPERKATRARKVKVSETDAPQLFD